MEIGDAAEKELSIFNQPDKSVVKAFEQVAEMISDKIREKTPLP
jgi:hypothetical protein